MTDYVADFNLDDGDEFNAEFELEEEEYNALLELNVVGSLWGSITGNISNQTDLQQALNSKADINYVDSIQGALNDQINALDSIVSDNYSDLNDKIEFNAGNISSLESIISSYGDIVNYDATDFADSAQGTLADSALQPGDNITELINNAGYITASSLAGYATESWVEAKGYLLPSDLNGYATESFVTSQGYITGINSTDVTNALGFTPVNPSSLATVATSGSYNDLINKPTIPAAQVQSDWDVTDTSSKAYIKNKPTIPSGVIVDQIYNPASTNAQSGVAINGAGFLTGITSTDVTSALGYTPYNSTNPSGYITSSDLPTLADLTTQAQLDAINSGATTTNIGQIATNTSAISDEVTNRQDADNNLQSQIDAITAASDVTDIVGTYAELQAYDTTTLAPNSIIKVLQDESQNDETTYYRWVITGGVGSWVLIGEEGPYYTKSEADSTFVPQIRTVNGYALSNNITLSAADVDALPDSTVIPTDTSQLTNGAGYISSIPSSYLQNLSSSPQLTILGTAHSNQQSINIGYSSSVSGRNSVVLGNNAGAGGNNSVVVGYNAKTTSGQPYATALGYGASAFSLSCIQLGFGTNSTPNSLFVGFYNNSNTHYNWQLLDGTTGLIPDARLSSNIARTSQIPSLTGYATENWVTSQGYLTSISSSDVTSALGFTPYNSTNPNGYISGITSSDVTTALGYTPYSASNPNGYTSNVGTVTSVNNTSPDGNGNVSITIPTVPTNISAFNNDSGYITGITSGDVTTALGYTPANNTDVVHLSGTETISGEKAFTDDFYCAGITSSISTNNKRFLFTSPDKSTVYSWLASSTNSNFVFGDATNSMFTLTRTYCSPAASNAESMDLGRSTAKFKDLYLAGNINGGTSDIINFDGQVVEKNLALDTSSSVHASSFNLGTSGYLPNDYNDCVYLVFGQLQGATSNSTVSYGTVGTAASPEDNDCIKARIEGNSNARRTDNYFIIPVKNGNIYTQVKQQAWSSFRCDLYGYRRLGTNS